MTLAESCREMARRSKAAAEELAQATTDAKNGWLRAGADALLAHSSDLLAANARDVSAAPSFGLNVAAVDRLTLSPARIQSMADGLRQVASLPDPNGEVLEESTRPNGLHARKIRVPLGVIFFLFESRPNVTADAAALCVKSGNAVILRGGKEAANTNAAIHGILAGELSRHGLPADAVQLVSTSDRDAVGEFLNLDEFIDLVIPRGGESLIRRVAAEAKMPVLKHYRGNCHVYVDASADLAMAERIVVNAKTQRPGVCNAAESLLVHEAIAGKFLPGLGRELSHQYVTVRGCPETRHWLPTANVATEDDYAAEYLDLILSIRVVPDLNSAIRHINRYGSHHTDAIVTNDAKSAEIFTKRIDSAAVIVNASTRFHDGFELGLGAEIGISTDKFHARGPCGLRELTTYKYVLLGTGQTRT